MLPPRTMPVSCAIVLGYDLWNTDDRLRCVLRSMCQNDPALPAGFPYFPGGSKTVEPWFFACVSALRSTRQMLINVPVRCEMF
eukprot:COSAG02_NODE_799_length_17084_cov_9.741242_11_plen_83_part_00